MARINIFFKAIILTGEFTYSKLNHIDAYYGPALINAYHDEKSLSGFGLYVQKSISDEIVTFEKGPFSEQYDYVFLCQSMLGLYKQTSDSLPLEDLHIFSETDSYHRIDEDLRFFREIEYIKEHFPDERVKEKYKVVYELHKAKLPMFFEHFERDGFLPFTLNHNYTGSIFPFEILAEKDIRLLLK